MYNYYGVVYNVVDGDTIDVNIDLGFKITIKQRLRLNGLDTPERGQPGYKEAKDWLTEKLLNQKVLITTSKPSKFGYYLAEIILDTIYINNSLLELNLAKPYSGKNVHESKD